MHRKKPCQIDVTQTKNRPTVFRSHSCHVSQEDNPENMFINRTRSHSGAPSRKNDGPYSVDFLRHCFAIDDVTVALQSLHERHSLKALYNFRECWPIFSPLLTNHQTQHVIIAYVAFHKTAESLLDL